MENNQITTIDKKTGFDIQYFQTTLTTAPEVLEQNRASFNKAREAANLLLENEQKVGMSDALDQQMKMFNDKAKKTLSAINERRKPFTQLVDLLKKEFTSIEADLSECSKRITASRDSYATKVMQEKLEAERKAAAALALRQEEIDVRRRLESNLAKLFTDYVVNSKNYILGRLTESTLETIEVNRNYVADIKGVPNLEKFKENVGGFTTSSYLLPQERVSELAEEIFNIKQVEYLKLYKDDILSYKQEVLDMFPSKQNQLTELAKLEDEDALEAALESERKLIEAQQAEINKQATLQSADLEKEVILQSTASSTAAIVDSQATLFNQSPKVKESYKINISNKGAYIQVAQFWFLNEGKDWESDKIEKMTFKRMVEFAEKKALSDNLRIDSPYITYEPVYKSK